jgi:hypothetical protein
MSEGRETYDQCAMDRSRGEQAQRAQCFFAGAACMSTSKEYKVGYCKPPEHSKWKKGQCGNPKRIRKRPVKPVAALIDEFLASEVEVVDDGIPQRRTAFEVIYLQL